MADTGFPSLPTYRVERGADTLPQTAQAALFTVTGRVKIIDIVGEVTTQIGNASPPNNTRLVANPTVGADGDLCANVDIANAAVGTLFTISGTFANAMIATASGALEAQAGGALVTAGTLDLNCGGSETGEVKWTVLYQPVDAGSSMVAA